MKIIILCKTYRIKWLESLYSHKTLESKLKIKSKLKIMKKLKLYLAAVNAAGSAIGKNPAEIAAIKMTIIVQLS